MSKQPDVLIIGGGVIGLTTAYFLARDGVRVSVIDKGDFGHEASWAGAGILPPAALSDRLHPAERMRAASVQMFPNLSAELKERTGIDNGFVRSGGLEVVPAGAETAREEWHAGEPNLQVLDAETTRRLEPALAVGLGQTYHLPDMAQVRNPRHMKALLAACQLTGVTLQPGCAAYGFAIKGGMVAAVKTAAGDLSAGKYLIASGAWADPLLEQVGCKLGIHPVRGQIALLNTGVPIIRHILLCGRQYMVPRPDGLVLVGSTEENAGFDKRTTVAAIAELLQLAAHLVPRLAAAHLERSWAGLRPGSVDGLPFLGPVPGFDNLFVAAGHFRAGIQLSPGTAQLLTECLLGRPQPAMLQPFRVDRVTR